MMQPGPETRRPARAGRESAPPVEGRRALLVLPAALVALAASAGLAGCGFRLRQPPHFDFKTIRLAMPNTALMQQLSRELTATHRVQVVSDPAKAEVTLVSTVGEQRERSVLSMDSNGNVLEYELRLRFAFRVTGPGGRELVPTTEILRRMNQSYSETAALSKEAEAQMLYQSMQDDVVQQVMRRLAMIRPDAPPDTPDAVAPPLAPSSSSSPLPLP